MADHDWPAALTPKTVSWGLRKAGVQFRSPFAGTVESIAFPGSWWAINVSLPSRMLALGSAGEAFFSRLAGGTERVRVPYWPRPKPRGTMRGLPVLALPAVRGDLSLTLNASGSLQAGDMIAAGTQLFQVFSDCSDLAGTLIVPIVNHVRTTIVAGSAVTWNAPTVLCCVPAMAAARGYEPGMASALTIDLEEAP